jgi:hypothetical protein
MAVYGCVCLFKLTQANKGESLEAQCLKVVVGYADLKG